jgi:hypothetical protein
MIQSPKENKMKKSILMITLVMVFGLFCNTTLWAGNGQQIKDGSMLNVSLDYPIMISGVVTISEGSGLTVEGLDDNGNPNGDITTVYGMGPSGYWESEEVLKPSIGDVIEIAAVSVDFSSGKRLIAITVSIGDEIVELRTDEGPAWRGISKQSGTSNATGDCSACPNSGTCDQSGGGTGTCPLVN